jgi:hypothetical protein
MRNRERQMSASGKERVASAVPPKIQRLEAYFTVGARMGHTSLNCECTRPEIGWRIQKWGHAKPAG